MALSWLIMTWLVQNITESGNRTAWTAPNRGAPSVAGVVLDALQWPISPSIQVKTVRCSIAGLQSVCRLGDELPYPLGHQV
jgi:hypothetical protein